MEDHSAVLYADLDQQFERLSRLQQDILYWLVIEREAVSLHTLYEDLIRPVSKEAFQEALGLLQRRYLMEATDHGFILQNVNQKTLPLDRECYCKSQHGDGGKWHEYPVDELSRACCGEVMGNVGIYSVTGRNTRSYHLKRSCAPV